MLKKIFFEQIKSSAEPPGTITVATAPWFDVVDKDGFAAKYIRANGITAGQQEQLFRELEASNIPFEKKNSPLEGGIDVIAVKVPHAFKIEEMKKNDAIYRLVVGSAAWQDEVHRRNGTVKYVDLGEISAEQRAALETSLKHQRISYEVTDIPVKNGITVLVAPPSEIDRLLDLRLSAARVPDERKEIWNLPIRFTVPRPPPGKDTAIRYERKMPD